MRAVATMLLLLAQAIPLALSKAGIRNLEFDKSN